MMVPEFGLMTLSRNSSSPSWTKRSSSIRRTPISIGGGRPPVRFGPPCRREYCRKSASETVNTKWIGSIDTMVESSVEFAAPPTIRLPGSTSLCDMRPWKGARISVKSRLSRA